MKGVLYLVILSLITIFTSCKVEIGTINYGSDQCNYCKMNIVDKQHAAQYVTKKGKQFKFDAIECMVHKVKEVGEEDLAFLRVSDYSNPGIMVDAKTSIFMISPEIKSPMGANLSAFGDINDAKLISKKHFGILYNWEEIKKEIKK